MLRIVCKRQAQHVIWRDGASGGKGRGPVLGKAAPHRANRFGCSKCAAGW